MRYVDTSVLLAFLLPEPGSNAAEAFMMSEGAPLAISSWSEAELLSALGIKLRMGQIREEDAHRTIDAYTQLLAPALRRLAIHDADHRDAILLLDGWKTALRAGDALHLAIANAHKATVFTFDKGMAKAALSLGISVELLAVR